MKFGEVKVTMAAVMPPEGISRSPRHGAMARAPLLNFLECKSVQTDDFLSVCAEISHSKVSVWYTKMNFSTPFGGS